MQTEQLSPGAPGISPRWTSSAKQGVGTALTPTSQVWFTLSHGILNEIYYPRVDLACTRDMGLVVTDDHGFFSEEKRDTRSTVEYIGAGVPAYRVTNTHNGGRYRIEKEFVADPKRDVVLQRTRFVPLQGALADYHVYAILAPHLGNRGYGNTGWCDSTKGVPMLFADCPGEAALAFACSTGWRTRSVSFVGPQDDWHDLFQHHQLTRTYTRAENGNVALTGEVEFGAGAGQFVLVIAFGLHAFSAGHHARASLFDGFDDVVQRYTVAWQSWQANLLSLDAPTGAVNLYRISTSVLHTHEAKQFPGGIIASLSIPWGDSKGDNDLGGYHLVWTRDLVETVGGLMAAGDGESARRVLRYLQITQEADGHWPQNMWLDGTPYWSGVQMDEVGFPILLTAQALEEGTLNADDCKALWPMIRNAVGYLARNGPVTQQDRWEEDEGYSPFTLAVEISALLAAAELATGQGETVVAAYLRETADLWNASIEQWTYVTGTTLSRRCGVDGYYVRIAPSDEPEAASIKDGFVPIKNRPPASSVAPTIEIVSPDALALVRFGLRAPDDPRILNTVTVIDTLLKADTPTGPAWYRYNDDGYGEHEDGTPFDGTGVGRLWPLFTGERAHYELAAGRESEARRLRDVMASFANEGGMLPEQIWDATDVPARELVRGRPSGSAMPLVWAHAEYIKLCRSLRDHRVFDMPPQTVQRYLVEKTGSPLALWRFNHKSRTIPAGQLLRVEVLAPATLHWTADHWQTVYDTPTFDTGLGVHIAAVPTSSLPVGVTLVFTFHWTAVDRWEGVDFFVTIAERTARLSPATVPGPGRNGE
ncbi:MAG: glucan 1,4-alpha-glucosidase [Herpetosiphon sp.]